MKRRCFGFAILLAFVLPAWGFAAQAGNGAEFFKLEAGMQRAVPFPHRRHQTTLNDCMVCHSLFDQQKGSIAKGIAGGTLTRRQIMNQLCIQCHRTEKEAARPAGPLACVTCHKG